MSRGSLKDALLGVVATCWLTDAGEATAQVADCDRLAESNLDTTRPSTVPGVAYDEIKGVEAVAACSKAIQERPREARLLFQLGRALQKTGNAQEQAASRYREATELGSAIAANNLAILHQLGIGVPKSDGEAAKWFRTSAAAGYAPTMRQYGLMVEEGQGLAKNLAEATSW